MATATDDTAAPSARGSLRSARACARRSSATRSSLVPMAVFGLFFIYPFGYAVYISFFDWGILGKHRQRRAAATTARSCTTRSSTRRSRTRRCTRSPSCPLEMALGLSLALIVNQTIRGRTFFRSAFYFPSIASSVAITTIAIYILTADGLFNQIIGGYTARGSATRARRSGRSSA